MGNLKTAFYVLGIIVGLLGLNEWLVSEGELDAFEVNVVGTLEQFQQGNEHQNDLRAYEQQSNLILQYELWLQQNPSNQQLRDSLNELRKKQGVTKRKLGL